MIITRADRDSTTIAGALFLPQRAHNSIFGEKKTSRVQGRRKVQQSRILYVCYSEKSKSGGV